MIVVRLAEPHELARVGALTAQAYLADGLLDASKSAYVAELRDAARRAPEADVLVAVSERGGVLGTVTFCLAGNPWAEVARSGEAEFRMLAVAPSARGRGIGSLLVRACLERAEAAGASALALSTMPAMAAAQAIYASLGFVREPARDWSPVAGVDLLAYTRRFGSAARAG
ncbi:MAG: GNAT family N-acetyltransferase [Actinomycetota bacterium]|nr:GNAT family N-acetyltransferase [Actinomycetota bacterium]